MLQDCLERDRNFGLSSGKKEPPQRAVAFLQTWLEFSSPIRQSISYSMSSPTKGRVSTSDGETEQPIPTNSQSDIPREQTDSEEFFNLLAKKYSAM